MKPQSKVWMFYISAILVLISTALYITHWEYAPYLFAVGAAGIAIYYYSTPYEGTNIRIKRLHRFEIYTGTLMVITSFLMFKHRSEWIVTLTIGAFFQLYTMLASGWEEKKE